ncbi:phosphotransferase family protein [Actinomadura macrotermitis]|uniref:Putative aminoglycoside phosphotransferase n=1 Tax=Actinomadura macrotermitis TaxID=2585200 RepID=A0A7K0BZ97_9ACTN|nr:phosphotransferase family protein [Actinomadura macrotermitis]MQY06515.1 putative aminoglycoside phosphotransferase [Actinomadura macrotermitis]
MTVDAELPAGVPGIDVPRLAEWLARALPGAGRITAIDLIAGGRSNLTYGITLAGGDRDRIVLRRPPLGHVLPTAHDMGREYRVLAALGAAGGVPVPETLAFCDDDAVIGARFYLMGFVEGRVLRTAEDAAGLTPAQARGLSERLAEALAAVHTVDVDAAGLGGFGRPEGYMARQLKRWGKQWDSSQEAIGAAGAVHEVPGYDRLVARLAERLPADAPARLVHGDFRLDNALARLEPRPEIAAVVDWEMSTLGDPLSDLGLTLVYWAEPGDEDPLPVGATITAAPGFFTRREFAGRYAELTGFDLAGLDFYVAFACFKLAVILEGIHARFLQKATVGEGFDQIGAAVPLLVGRAHRILDSGSPW